MNTIPSATSVAALVERVKVYRPQLSERAERAAGIVLQHGYTWGWSGDEHDTLIVGKLDKGEVSAVYNVNGSCNCPDYTERAPEVNGHRWCKHRIARAMLLKLEEEREEQQAEQWRAFAQSCKAC